MSEEDILDESAETTESTTPINRRRFVKALGVAGSATAFGTLGSAHAAGTNNQEKPDVKTLHDSTAQPKIQKARNTEEYKLLEEYLRSTENLIIVEADIEVHARDDIEGQGRKSAVSFPVTSTTTEDIVRSGITAGLSQGRVQSVTAVKSEEIDEKTNKITYYEVVDGDVQEETISINTETATIDDATAEGTFSTQSSLTCDACFAAGNLTCAIGCGAPITTICYLSSAISGLAGSLACGAFVTIFCGAIIFITEHIAGAACGADPYIECACERIGAGNCSDGTVGCVTMS
jgi:hypothetical protein